MIGKRLLFGLALAAFSMSACDRADKSPVQADPQGSKGSARIALPKLPAGYLAAAGQKAWFSLIISGQGMAPMTRSWIVGPDAPPPLEVDGIPVGLRSFRGRLIRVDSSGGDTTVTHEGVDSAWIQRDSVAEVHLFLHQLGSVGSAHVCVEVEGWASDSSCVIPPPPPPPIPGGLFGCYALVVSKPGPIPGKDTLFKASLRIMQTDSLLFATVTWNPGYTDSASGLYFGGSAIHLGTGSFSDFSFQAQIDSAGRLTGYFYDSLRFIMGNAQATPASCYPETTVTPPPPPPPVQRLCFAFSQAQSDGKTVKGRVGFEIHGDYADTYTHWNGFGSEAGMTSLLMGSPDSSGLVIWPFSPPTGMFPKNLGVDSAEYEVTLAGATAQGKIMKLNAPTRALGTWTGTRAQCLDSDFAL